MANPNYEDILYQFVLIHVVNFITHSNTNGSAHQNCDVPFKNMVFHIEFHMLSNYT